MVGSITVQVREGDFPTTVRDAVEEQLRKCDFLRPDSTMRVRVCSERGYSIVNNFGYSMRFITDGHQLFIKGMWAYGALEPCTKMTVEIEYV